MLFLIATADYTGTTENHLSFTKGSRIEFIERTEGGFIKGKLNGKVGILPSSLITIETRPLSIIAHSTPNNEVFGNNKVSSENITSNNNNVTPSPTNSSISSAVKEDIVITPTVQTPIDNNNNNNNNTNTPTTTTTTTTPTTTTTTTTPTNEEEEDDDSTDSEDERKIIVKPTGTDGNNTGDGADIKSLSLSDSKDSSFLNLRASSQDTESRREKKKKAGAIVSEGEGLFRKSKHSSSSKKRRYANRKYLPNIVVSNYEDLPIEIKNDMQYEDLLLEEIKANFKIYLRVVKFITRQRFTYIPPDENNMTITQTITTTDENGAAVTTTVVTTTKTVDNENQKIISQPLPQEEIRTSTFDTEIFTIDSNLDEKDKKAKHVELKLERKRTLTGTTAEFLGQASTTIKVISDIKKKIKFGDMVGKGAFGKVYEAHYEKKKVAIKVVPYSNPKQQHSVLTEIGFLSKCKHANILSYKNSVLYNSDLFIISEFLQGGTLEQAVSSPHVFKESQIGYIGKEILKGIEYLHEKKLVHRDLKSANIMISVDGEIKLIDFGLCASVEKDSHFHMVGSPYWMAPEMIRGENISYPADIWSFGICMLELLNKKPPHRESRLKAMFTNTTKGIDFSKIKCSLDLKDMLWQCFNLNPARRSSANKLLRHPFFKRAETKSGMKGLWDNMFLQRNLNSTGFFY